jgi:hypothetical protein
MANVRFLDQVSVSAFGNTGDGGGSSISSSYAETASFAQSGDGNFSGSFSGSFQGDGSNLTGIVTDPFPYTGSALISGSLNLTGSLSVNSGIINLSSTPTSPGINSQVNIGADSDTSIKVLKVYSNAGYVEIGPQNASFSHFYTDRAKYYFNKPLQVAGEVMSHTDQDLVLGNRGGTSDTITISTNDIIFELNNNNIFYMTTGSSGLDSILSGSATSTASFGTYLGDGSQLTGISTTPFPFSGSAVITGSLEISGSSDVTLDVKGDLNVSTNITASNNISASNNIFTKQLYVENNLAIDYDFSHNCISFGNVSDCLNLLGTSITASSNLSSSAASTASFGTYLGDGSQLTGISTTPFPFSGSAVITGSLVVSGSSKPLEVIGSGSTVFSIQGSLGELFAIDDQLSGSLLVVNDISGIPQLEVFSDGRTLIGADPRSLYTTAIINATSLATSQSIYSLSTSSYDGVFFDYTVTSASNARAGNIMSIWNGGNLVYTENTTTDIGSTTGVTFNVEISQSQAQLISVTDTEGWKIKTTIRSI